jgi:primosomal protein N' (replication factor Y)
MDVDTTGAKGSHEALLSKFSEEKTDILLGTQMVSKGLDFENVTLVGVLAADQSLGIDDFRANERTFNLITQVCGRAGRGTKQGRAVIQTYMPENETLTLAKSQDYISFYNEEIKIRKALNFPPFCDIVSVLLTGENEYTLTEYAHHLKNSLETVMKKDADCDFEILGPTSALIPKINSKYRQRIWIKCKMNEKTQDIFLRLRAFHIKNKNNINMVIENNPYNTL